MYLFELHLLQRNLDETLKSVVQRRSMNMKELQKKVIMNKKEVKYFNHANASPGDIIFSRVLNLLSGVFS